MKEEITKEKAEQFIAKQRQARIEKCTQEINKVLDENKCALDVSMLVEVNKITPIIKILSME